MRVKFARINKTEHILCPYINCIIILGICVPLCGTVIEPQHPLECDRQQERHKYLFNYIYYVYQFQQIQCRQRPYSPCTCRSAANNRNGKRTAQPSEMGKYSTPELQAAFNSGREIGRTEGMLYYIKHASENMQKEAEKLSAKLQMQRAKV